MTPAEKLHVIKTVYVVLIVLALLLIVWKSRS